MRYVSGFLTFLLVVVLVLFAVSNTDEARLTLFPLPQQITAPLYLISFLLIFCGFILGGIAAWNAGRKHRRLARQSGKRIQILEGDLASMRARAESSEERAAQLSAPKTEAVGSSALGAPVPGAVLPLDTALDFVDNPELL